MSMYDLWWDGHSCTEENLEQRTTHHTMEYVGSLPVFRFVVPDQNRECDPVCVTRNCATGVIFD